MQPQRLSYGTAGAAPQPRIEPPSAPRSPAPALARVPAGLEVALPYGGGSPMQARRRRVVIATMIVVHGVAVLGLLNASRLRDVVVDAKPIFLAVVDTPAPAAPPKSLPPPPTVKAPPPPLLQMPLIAPEPSTAPSPLVAQAVVPPPAPVAETPPAPTPAAPVAPRTIPPSGVQFLVPPAPVYSRISYKMHESGRAVVRVFIDATGTPRNVQLVTSTGFARLDDSALTAVRNARFKPYLENGVAVEGWASVPIDFELPQ